MADLPTPLNGPPFQITPAETPSLRSLLTVAVSVVVVAGLYFGRSVLIPITLAMLLSFLLAPLVNLLRRVRLGRVPSVLLAVLLALTVILGLGGLIGTQVAGLAEDAPRYASTIQHKVDTLQQLVLSHMTDLTRALGGRPAHVAVAVNAKQGGASAPADAQKPIAVEVRHPTSRRCRLHSASSRRWWNRCPPLPSC